MIYPPVSVSPSVRPSAHHFWITLPADSIGLRRNLVGKWTIIIIIIIIIMSLFNEDDIFSKQCTNLTYGPH